MPYLSIAFDVITFDQAKNVIPFQLIDLTV